MSNSINSFKKALIWGILFLGLSTTAEEWPTYRADNARSGKTTNKLQFPLQKVWEYIPAQAPNSAWPEPGWHENNRLDFDYAHQPVIADGTVFWGSTADDSVRAMDLQTGKLKWIFTTNGPVRFAPQIVGKKSYFTSDDGFLYCLNSANGKELWRFQGALKDDKILGNGRMISRWPCRSGVLVDNGVAYITAGIWPSEGIFIYALNAENGKIIWCNDTCNFIMKPGKHYASWELSGISPQGYLSVSKEILIVPTGRGFPCQFDRKTGKFLTPNHSLMIDPRSGKFFNINAYNTLTNSGGVWSMVVPQKNVFISAGSAGNGFAAYLLSGSKLLSKKEMRDAPYPLKRLSSGKRAVMTEKTFFATGGNALILADNALIEGNKRTLQVRDIAANKQLFGEVYKDDIIHGLAVADGYLLVATDQGKLICYGPKTGQTVKIIKDKESPAPQPSPFDSKLLKLLSARKINKGYALLVNPENANLAEVLANKTKLHTIVVMSDASKVKSERKRLISATGFYGSRISLLHLKDMKEFPFGPYFANVIVVSSPAPSISGKEVYRLLHPCGGIMTFINNSGAADWLKKAGITTGEINKFDGLEIVTRGKLPGAFDWDSKATEKSLFPFKKIQKKNVAVDKRVKWPLEMLWYGGFGPAMMNNRHWSPSTPVPANGRYFVIGKNNIVAADAYNGTMLWSQQIQNAATVNTLFNKEIKKGPISLVKSLSANDHSVYVNVDGIYIQYDAQTGEQQAVFGNFAEIKNLSLNKPQNFKLRLDDKHSGTISIRKDKIGGINLVLNTKDPKVTWHDEWELYFDFRPFDKRFGTYGKGTFQSLIFIGNKDYYRRDRVVEVRPGAGKIHPEYTLTRKKTDSGIEITLNIPPEEIKKLTDDKEVSFGFSAILNASDSDRRFDGRDNNLQQAYLTGAKAPALNDGWPNIFLGPAPTSKSAAQARKSIRPLAELPEAAKTWSPRPPEDKLTWAKGPGTVIGKRVHPLTGKKSAKRYIRGYGCRVNPISSENTLFFRSSALGLYDTTDDSGLRVYDGLRPGCKGGLLPALGLFIASESSSGCVCSFSFQTSLALVPAEKQRNEDWARFLDIFPDDAIKQIALNLGAPGDRRDAKKELWLGFPRPRVRKFDPHPAWGTYLAMEVPLYDEGIKGFGPDRQSADRIPIADTKTPWLYTSYYRGLEKLVFDLQPAGVWSSRLTDTAPRIDGKLDDACWQNLPPLLNTSESTPTYLRHDKDNLYIAFKQRFAYDAEGNPVKWGDTVTEDDGEIWKGRSYELYFTTDIGYYHPNLAPKKEDKIAMHLGLSGSGARFDSIWRHKKGVKKRDANEDLTWNGNWQGKVAMNGDIMTGEFAIPIKLLKDSGIDPERLQMVIGQHLGRFQGNSRGWVFRNITYENRTFKPEDYTVRLHFAEPDDVKTGERVFDILLQGKVMAKNFDIIKEANARNKALIKEFTNIKASKYLKLELKSKSKKKTRSTVPLLNAIEVIKEK